MHPLRAMLLPIPSPEHFPTARFPHHRHRLKAKATENGGDFLCPAFTCAKCLKIGHSEQVFPCAKKQDFPLGKGNFAFHTLTSMPSRPIIIR